MPQETMSPGVVASSSIILSVTAAWADRDPRASAIDTVSGGTNAGSRSIERSATSSHTNVPRNSPSTACDTGSRTMLDTIRVASNTAKQKSLENQDKFLGQDGGDVKVAVSLKKRPASATAPVS